jgi:polyphosphate kinase 2 (PPK2 family)
MADSMGTGTGDNQEFHIVDLAATEGYLVDDSDEDDPVLITPDGHRVDTWRENYPYEERLDRDEYESTKRALQIELLKWQNWTKDTGQKHVILFEGRDAAGKGGTI